MWQAAGARVWSVGRRTLTGAMHIKYPGANCRAVVDELKLGIILTWRTVDRLDKVFSSVTLPACAIKLPQVLMTGLNLGDRGIVIGSVGFKASRGNRTNPYAALRLTGYCCEGTGGGLQLNIGHSK